MPIEVVRLALGPLDNNTYLLADSDQKVAVVVDPSFGSQAVLDEVAMRGWSLRQIWLTHAHFDHLAGIYEIEAAYQPALLVGLHPADLPLWENRGDADQFGLTLDPGPRPTLWFEHGQHLSLGNEVIEVRHVPGHTPGHVAFYHASGILWVGDLIFKNSVGRTDLAGGNFDVLLASIRSQVFSLPDATRLLPGHGPETNVGAERAGNPFVS
ncbi:MAG TPA: MBL fold metallo-hydrolase [Anaerolineaceae bacterium]|jgi:hydroxyacylglutathione hydrolase